MNALTLQHTKLGKIHGYEKNAKTHSEHQAQQIVAPIKQFGFNNPILINENNEIIAGHGRFMAAQAIQLETVPTIQLPHLTDVQKRAYRLTDNKIAENGGRNMELQKRIAVGEIVNWADDYNVGGTPLTEALVQGASPEIIAILVANGANVKASMYTNSGRAVTPLEILELQPRTFENLAKTFVILNSGTTNDIERYAHDNNPMVPLTL